MTGASPLRVAFVAAASRDDVATDLEERLRALVDASRAAWPSLAVDDAAFVAHLATKTTADVPMSRALSALHATDLYLTFACGTGDARALAAFEGAFGREVPAALSRMRADATSIDEIGQVVRTKLFVGASPKILEFAGRGPLRSWLRAVIVRTAVDLRRREQLEPPVTADGELGDEADASRGELALVRARYAAPLKTAFEDALRALPLEDRTVLRMHLLDGLNIDEIGTLHGVHRATIARWIKRAREDLLVATRRLLRERLKVDTAELESLGRACRSSLDVSVRGILGG